jgi:membrane protease YdiL (CAAX protease family)
MYSYVMDPSLKRQLIEIGISLFTLAIVFAACKFRKLPLRETLGLFVPKPKTILFWTALYLPIFIVGEIVYFGLGLNEGNVWEWEGFITVIRILKIALIGPIVEELIYRGILFDQLSRMRPGPIGALILSSIIFAASHYSLDYVDMAIIFVDGLYMCWVRYKTGSILIPVIIHIFINAMAVVEFLFINARFS